MTVDQLLLTATRSAQLTAALANAGIAAPLDTCLAEAAPDVARYTAGYTLSEDALNSLIRPLALHKAYGLVGPVPEDVQKQFDAALKELIAIAEGKRPSLPRAIEGQQLATGAWGSQTKIDTTRQE